MLKLIFSTPCVPSWTHLIGSGPGFLSFPLRSIIQLLWLDPRHSSSFSTLTTAPAAFATREPFQSSALKASKSVPKLKLHFQRSLFFYSPAVSTNQHRQKKTKKPLCLGHYTLRYPCQCLQAFLNPAELPNQTGRNTVLFAVCSVWSKDYHLLNTDNPFPPPSSQEV